MTFCLFYSDNDEMSLFISLQMPKMTNVRLNIYHSVIRVTNKNKVQRKDGHIKADITIHTVL